MSFLQTLPELNFNFVSWNSGKTSNKGTKKKELTREYSFHRVPNVARIIYRFEQTLPAIMLIYGS